MPSSPLTTQELERHRLIARAVDLFDKALVLLVGLTDSIERLDCRCLRQCDVITLTPARLAALTVDLFELVFLLVLLFISFIQLPYIPLDL